MKKKLLILSAALLSAIALCKAADVEPASIDGHTVFRDNTDSSVNNLTYIQGNTLLLTNWTIIAGNSATGAVQDLTGVTVSFAIGRVGDSENVITNGTAINATGGTCFVQFTMPTNISNPQVQITVTDASSVSYTYNKQTIQTSTKIE